MKRKYKKSVLLPLILFVYTTAMAVYFLPQNTQVGNMEKWCTLGGSYLIIALLWYVLRKKEQLMTKREEEKNRLEKQKPEQSDKQ